MSSCVLPGMDDMGGDLVNAFAMLDLGENKGAVSAHFYGVAFHDLEVRADDRREVCFVYDQKVRLGDARSAFTRDFIASSNVDDLDSEIGKFAAEAGGEVVSARFNQEKIGLEFAVKFLKGEEIGGNVFTDRSVGAASRFDRANAFGGQGVVADEKFAVFLGKDVIGHDGDAHAVAQMKTKLEHKSGLAAAHRATDPDGESALGKIAVQRHVAVLEMAGVVHVFVGVTMFVRVIGIVGMVMSMSMGVRVVHKINSGTGVSRAGRGCRGKGREAGLFERFDRATSLSIGRGFLLHAG
jgi:hypothetical protein